MPLVDVRWIPVEVITGMDGDPERVYFAGFLETSFKGLDEKRSVNEKL
jgi:hypothetical protein